MSSPARWWYGVAAFPLVVVTALLSRFGLRRFVRLTAGTGGDPNVGPVLASFVLSVLAGWVGAFVAIVVLVCLVLDVRAVRRAVGENGGSDGDARGWSPSWAWSLAGVVHLAGALFAPLLVVSVPALSTYVYQRYRGGGGTA